MHLQRKINFRPYMRVKPTKNKDRSLDIIMGQLLDDI